MAMETMVFEDELKKLEEQHQKLKNKDTELRQFILSAAFLVNTVLFYTLLGDFQSLLMTAGSMAGITTTFPEQVKQQARKETAPFSLRSSHVLILAVVFIALIILSLQTIPQRTVTTLPNGTLVETTTATPMVPISLLPLSAFAVIVLLFLPNIRSFIQKPTDLASAKTFEDWVRENLDTIRRKYRGAVMLSKVQTVKDIRIMMPHYADIWDEMFINREKFFAQTLPAEFLSKIGSLVNLVDRAVYERRAFLFQCIVEARKPVMPMRGPAGMR